MNNFRNKIYNWANTDSKSLVLRQLKKYIIVKHNNRLMNINTSFLKNFFMLLKYNSIVTFFLLTLACTNIYFYTKGQDSRTNEVDSLLMELTNINDDLGITSELLNDSNASKEELEKELEEIKQSRLYLTSLIKHEADVDIPERVSDEHLNLMLEQADLYDLPYKVYFRVIRKESNFKHWVTSHVGAGGYMQVMPKTYNYYANKLNLTGPMTPENNIKVGSYYLRKKYDEFFNKVIHKQVYDKLDISLNRSVNSLSEEEYAIYEKECSIIKEDTTYFNNENVYIWELALSAYNAGSGNVKYSVPNITETKNYVKFILKPYYEKK